MDDSSFEGTEVLEKLAQINKVEDFFDAVDSDDFVKAKSLMQRAGVDYSTIELVFSKMGHSDEER